MKILHVVPYFSPAWAYGGPPRAVFEIAKQQIKKGHEVYVLTTDAFESDKVLPSGHEEVEGIKVIRLKNYSNYLMWNYHFCTPKGVAKTVRELDVDCIHLHEARTLLNIQVLRSFYHQEIPFYFSPWGTLSYNDQLVSFKKIFDVLFLNLFQKKVNKSFGQTDHEVEVLKQFKIGKEKLLVPLGIDVDQFNELPSPQILRKELSIDEKDYLFVFLGRYSEKKGLKLLFQSFVKLLEHKPHARLLCVGRDDGYLAEMKSLIKDLGINKNVIISGPLYDKERLKAYTAADCFISTPIAYEETSTTCLEALACGTPVITTHQAAIPFLTKEDGVIEISDKENDIVAAMSEMMEKKLKVSQSKLRKHFDWQSICDIFINCYV